MRDDVPTPQHRARLLAAQPIYDLSLSVFPLPNVPFDPSVPCMPASETMGQGDLTDGCNAEFLGTGSNTRKDDHVDIKGDIRLGEVSNLSLTYARGRPFRSRPDIFLNNANDRDWVTEAERGTAAFTTGGADWTSETRFTYNLNDMFRLDKIFLVGDPNGPEEVLEFDNRVATFRTGDLGWSGPDGEIFLLEGYVWSLSEKFAKHVGNHSFKFGGGYTRHCCIRTNPENPRISYQSYDDILNNVPSTIRPTFGSGKFKGRMYEFDLFVQDDWRVNDRLVLNIGLRYDFFSNMVAKARGDSPLQTGFFNADGLLDDQFTFGPIRDIENPYEHDSINIGPRFGFAYRLDDAGDTVIRGGVGVLFSAQTPGMAWQSVNLDLGVPFRTEFPRAQVAELGFNFDTPNRTLREFVAQDFLVNQNVNTFSYFDPDLENPYAIHWNFGIQRKLADDLMLETAYVANRGVKFVMHRRANQVIRTGPQAGIRPNPKLNLSGYYVDSSQTTKYHSWQTSLRKRYSKNFTASFHYTYSKALSNNGGDVGAYYQGDNTATGQVQDFFNLPWGPSAGDVTHYVAADWVLDLPSFAGMSGAARHILGGWQVSGVLTANSGQAFTLRQSASGPPARPDFIGGEPILDQGKQYLNPAAFALVPRDPVSRAAIRPGNVGLGFLRDTSRWNMDFSFGKNIHVNEQVKLRFRVDMFNAMNHIFANGLRTNLSRSRFGTHNNLSNARTVQMNLRMTF